MIHLPSKTAALVLTLSSALTVGSVAAARSQQAEGRSSVVDVLTTVAAPTAAAPVTPGVSPKPMVSDSSSPAELVALEVPAAANADKAVRNTAKASTKRRPHTESGGQTADADASWDGSTGDTLPCAVDAEAPSSDGESGGTVDEPADESPEFSGSGTVDDGTLTDPTVVDDGGTVDDSGDGTAVTSPDPGQTGDCSLVVDLPASSDCAGSVTDDSTSSDALSTPADCTSPEPGVGDGVNEPGTLIGNPDAE